jgi:hypothetical protein
MDSFLHGTLAILWRDGGKPRLPIEQISQLYDHIRRPALQCDAIRLFQAWQAHCRRPSLDFDRYQDGLMEFKTGIGRLALPDLAVAETALNEMHALYLDNVVQNGMQRYCEDKVEELSALSLPAGHASHMAARMQCIAYNSTGGIVDFSNRFRSIEHRAALYDAELASPGGSERLMKETWIETRRIMDRREMHDDIYALMMAPELQKRYQAARDAHNVEPSESPMDAKTRRGGFRLVAA